MRRIVLNGLFVSALAVVAGCGGTTETTDVANVTTDSVEPKPADQKSSVVPLGWTSEVKEGELTVGNPAPPISIAEFVHGDPVTTFENGKVYVVEFWATWCGPCLQGMPHISSLADKYRGDVHFVGVTGEGEDADGNWSLSDAKETVTEFLGKRQSADKTWAEVVTYSLALDDNRTTNQAYMEAAGQGGIPTAFIVGRDGVLEWVGHPMSMDDTLAAVVEGSYDREAAFVEIDAARRIDDAIKSRDYDTAIAEIDKLITKSPDDLRRKLQKLAILDRAGRTDDLNALQAELVKSQWDDHQLLNMIAWGIAAENSGTDLDLAMKSARRASELTGDADASVLDTVARVFYEQKNLEEAIAWQKKAVDVSDDDGAANGIAKSLKRYESELDERKKKAEADKKAAEDKAAEDKAAEKAAAEKAAAEKAAAAKAASEAKDKADADKDADKEAAKNEAAKEKDAGKKADEDAKKDE